MIAKGRVLLRVEDLEQGRGRVAAEVGADLVDLVEHEHRVAGTGLVDPLQDAARQRADVGAAMAADLGLVADAAERQADELAPQRAGDGAAERGLADARRADEAEDRALALGVELAHRQVLEDALLDLLEVVVVLVEDRAGVFQVEVVLAVQAPGQTGQPVEIGSRDRALGAVGVTPLEPADLPLDLLESLLGEVPLARPLAVAGDLGRQLFALAELVLDRLELLAEEELALALVHLAARLHRDLLLHGQQLDLAQQQLADSFQPRERRRGLEDPLRLGYLEVQVAGRQVGQPAGIVEVGGDDHHLGRDALAQVHRVVEVLLDAAHQGLDLELGPLGGLLVDRPHLGQQKGLALAEVLDPGPADALHQDAQPAVRQLQHAHDAGSGAEPRQIVLPRVVEQRAALGQQHQHPVLGQGLIDRAHALVAAHRQRQDDERIGDDVLERQHRHDVRQLRGLGGRR